MPRNLTITSGDVLAVEPACTSPASTPTPVSAASSPRDSGASLARAVAASSAVPGCSLPQPVGDRRCMDGGVSGSGLDTDLLAGARRVVVLALTDGSGVAEWGMTAAPGSVEAELAALEASGSDVLVRTPHAVDFETLMDPARFPTRSRWRAVRRPRTSPSSGRSWPEPAPGQRPWTQPRWRSSLAARPSRGRARHAVARRSRRAALA